MQPVIKHEWEAQNFIFTAIDSKTARKYIINQHTKYNKHLTYNGTLWAFESCQIIVPLKTISYNDKPDLSDYSISLCTLRNFISKIEHCIECGLNQFNELFANPFEDLKAFLENKDEYFNYIEKEDTGTLIISKM